MGGLNYCLVYYLPILWGDLAINCNDFLYIYIYVVFDYQTFTMSPSGRHSKILERGCRKVQL